MFKRKRNIENEVNWLSDKVQYVDLVELENYSELNFLKPLLSEKKLVLLGENGHGVKEHTQIKSKLIKYLYQELGFKVLAFESSLGDCSFSSQQQMNMNAEQLIKQSLFKVWHTEEMLDLFAWIKDTQSCQSPLTFTGIDIQPSSKESITSKTLCSIFSHIEEAYGNEIMDLEKKC
ncbi:erythromycin esterase family protein [Priestia sp. OVS21]|nr:erythromycin esterase family protein [Priestia sp. OVS21]